MVVEITNFVNFYGKLEVRTHILQMFMILSVLYGCESRSLSPREESMSRMTEVRMLGGLRFKKERVMRGWGRFCKKKFYNLHCLSDIILLNQSIRNGNAYNMHEE
jgi:hypothetical protein